jgi:hypothetical protein
MLLSTASRVGPYEIIGLLGRRGMRNSRTVRPECAGLSPSISYLEGGFVAPDVATIAQPATDTAV